MRAIQTSQHTVTSSTSPMAAGAPLTINNLYADVFAHALTYLIPAFKHPKSLGGWDFAFGQVFNPSSTGKNLRKGESLTYLMQVSSYFNITIHKAPIYQNAKRCVLFYQKYIRQIPKSITSEAVQVRFDMVTFMNDCNALKLENKENVEPLRMAVLTRNASLFHQILEEKAKVILATHAEPDSTLIRQTKCGILMEKDSNDNTVKQLAVHEDYKKNNEETLIKDTINDITTKFNFPKAYDETMMNAIINYENCFVNVTTELMKKAAADNLQKNLGELVLALDYALKNRYSNAALMIIEIACRLKYNLNNIMYLSGWKHLIVDADKGQHDLLKILFDKVEANELQLDVNVPNDDGDTAFILAAFTGEKKVAELVLLHIQKRMFAVGNLDTVNPLGRTFLMYALQCNLINLIQNMIDRPAGVSLGVNKKDCHGYTALMVAAETNNEDVVTFLLKNSVSLKLDINATNEHGNTALIIAAQHGYTTIVERMLNHAQEPPLDVNVKNCTECTALMFASANGHIGVVQLLLDHKGLQVNSGNIEGVTALMFASMSGHTAVVQLLLVHTTKKRLPINIGDNEGITAQMKAYIHGRTSVARLLHPQVEIEIKGLLVNAGNKDGWTDLMIASAIGDTDAVQRLLAKAEKKEMLVNARNNYGWTALMIASVYDQTGVVQLLLDQAEKNELDINARSYLGWTALLLALRMQCDKAATTLLSNTTLRLDLHIKNDNDKWTALMFAIWRNRALVKLLLDRANFAPDPILELQSLIKATDSKGKTTLMRAASCNTEGVGELLLEQAKRCFNREELQSYVNAKSSDDETTALIIAADRGHLEFVQTLINHTQEVQLDFNATNKEGKTALMLAEVNKHQKIVDLLKKTQSSQSSQSSQSIKPDEEIKNFSQLDLRD